MAVRSYFFTRSQPTGTDRLEGKFCRQQIPPHDGGTSEAEAIPLQSFAGQFWWVEVDRGALNTDIRSSAREVAAWTKEGQHQTMATEEIADTLDKGVPVRAFAGPFATREEASRRMDIYWDAMMGHED